MISTLEQLYNKLIIDDINKITLSIFTGYLFCDDKVYHTSDEVYKLLSNTLLSSLNTKDIEILMAKQRTNKLQKI